MADQKNTIDNWNPILLEYPFVRKGMTEEEYYAEKAYYLSRPIDDLKNGLYIPLWKQKENKN